MYWFRHDAVKNFQIEHLKNFQTRHFVLCVDFKRMTLKITVMKHDSDSQQTLDSEQTE